jgi:hypothetical protein
MTRQELSSGVRFVLGARGFTMAGNDAVRIVIEKRYLLAMAIGTILQHERRTLRSASRQAPSKDSKNTRRSNLIY